MASCEAGAWQVCGGADLRAMRCDGDVRLPCRPRESEASRRQYVSTVLYCSLHVHSLCCEMRPSVFLADADTRPRTLAGEYACDGNPVR